MKRDVITMYGAPWCPDCRRSKAVLDKLNVPYVYIDLQEVPDAAEKITALNDGYQKIPTIIFPDKTILVEPSDAELEKKIKEL